MAVMNRSMFRRPQALPPMSGPMPVVRETYPVVKREEGSPPSGEGKTGILNKISDFFTFGRSDPESRLIIGGEYFDPEDPNFKMFIEKNYMDEGDTYVEGIEKFRIFAEDQMRNRAEGSPPQGEMVEEQVDVENVGIMDGFKENNPEQVAEQVMREGERSRKEIAESDTYDELMQAIRGDKLTEEDRRDELASIVGKEDADRTPDSVLVLVQPVMQMMNAETANTGIAQIEDGSMQMPQQPVGVANGGYMRSFPNQNLNIESLTASDNIDNRIMKNLEFENMNKGIMGYAMGGLVKPVQKFSTAGSVNKSFQEEYLPMYMGLKDYYLPNKDAGVADALMSLSKAGFMYGMGAKPEESAALFFDEVGKKGSKRAATEAALKGQLASGALSSAIKADLAAKDRSSKQKMSLVMTGDEGKDSLIAAALGYSDVKDLYRDYPNKGTIFSFEGGSFTGSKVPDKKTESFTVVGVAGNTSDRKKIEELGLDFDILPPNTQVGYDENNQIEFVNAPAKKKIEYTVTYPVIVGNKVETNTVVLDLSKGKDLEAYNNYMKAFMESDKTAKNYYKFERIGSMSFESPDVNVTFESPQLQAKGGFIQKRSSGSSEEGETSEEVEIPKPATDLSGIINVEETTPIIKQGSSAEQVLLQKANQGEAALELLDQLYFLALTKPQYFGLLGGVASYGKSGYLSLDQIIESMTGLNLPEIKFLEAPEIDQIVGLVDSISSKLASVEKEGTFRSVTDKEKNAKKDLLNVYAGNAERTMDSIKQIRETLVNDINRFYDQTGNENKKFEVPDFYNKEPEKIDKDMQFELIKSKLPPDMLELLDTDPQIKNALEAIMNGADVDLVIKRYREYKKNKQN